MKKITKAVFPVAGLGTRFLPVTKASPKEMLPVVDKPLIQYAVEEAAAAGVSDMICITGRNKRAIEDHFDKAFELEAELQAHGKNKQLKEVRNLLPEGVTCAYVRQAEALGLGHAVMCAQGRWVCNEKRLIDAAGLGSVQSLFAHVPSEVPDLIRWIDAQGIELEDVHLKRPTLEDVFIELTGKRLRD